MKKEQKITSAKTALSATTKPTKVLINAIDQEILKLGSYVYEYPSFVNILDYGAGYGRNSNELRSLGYRVYSFDPYNGAHFVDPYKSVSCSNPLINPFNLQSAKYAIPFTLIFTCNVLNVINKEDQEILLDELDLCSPNSIKVHLISQHMKAKLKKGEDTLYTSKGLQRLVNSEDLLCRGYKRQSKNLYVKR